MQHGSLTREVGFFQTMALGVGAMICAGIFLLSGYAAQIAGPAAIYSFLLAGGAVLVTALSFAELATAFPSAGGPYVYVHQGLGSWAGFIAGWSLWVGLILTSAFYAMGFGRYFLFFFPNLDWKPLALLILLFTTAVNLMGSRGVGRLQAFAVTLLLGILCIYIILGYNQLDYTLHEPFLPYGWPPVFRVAAVVFISFLGFELISTAAEEVKNPGLFLPLATILSIALVAILYAAILYVVTGLAPAAQLGASPTPIADTAVIILGTGGGAFTGFAGLLATLSSLNVSIMGAARILLAMSRSESLPPLFAHLTKKGVPMPAVALSALGIVFCLFWGDVEWLAETSAFLHLLPFILVNVSLIYCRRHRNYRPSFRAPGGMFFPLLGIISAFALITQIHFEDIALCLLFLFPGVAYFYLKSVLNH